MSSHKHDLDVPDWQSCVDFDDEEKALSVFLTCSVDGCEYWRKDYYDYAVSEFPNEMTFLWIELMALGLLRGDFSLNDVQIALPHCDEIFQCGEQLLSK